MSQKVVVKKVVVVVKKGESWRWTGRQCGSGRHSGYGVWWCSRSVCASNYFGNFQNFTFLPAVWQNFEINEVKVTAAVTSKQLKHNAWNWHKTFNILKDKPLTMTQKDCSSWVYATFTDGAAPKTDPWRSDRF